MAGQFRKATRQKAKASILLQGLSGKGKSFTALMMANVLADEDWDTVYAVDTENKSLDLTVGIKTTAGFPIKPFNIADLGPEEGYAPSHYLGLRELAIRNGAKVIIQDSITHAWTSAGGVLDLVTKVKASSKQYNDYTAWGDAKVVEEKNKLTELFRDARAHVISTVRVKEKQEMIKDEATGKMKLQSLDEQPIQQADIKYEPDLVLNILDSGAVDQSNGKIIKHTRVEVVKSRYALFVEGQEYELTIELLKQLKQYLDEGIDPEELFEAQRLDFVTGLKEFLTANPNKKAIAEVMKKDAGYEDKKFSELPLDAIKKIYNSLIQ